MTNRDLILERLDQIVANQEIALARQEEHLRIAQEQAERARAQAERAIELQGQAMDRFKTVSRLALPAIIGCIVLIVYLLVRYL